MDYTIEIELLKKREQALHKERLSVQNKLKTVEFLASTPHIWFPVVGIRGTRSDIKLTRDEAEEIHEKAMEIVARRLST